MRKYFLVVFCLGLLSCNSGTSIPTEEVGKKMTIAKNDSLQLLLSTAIPIEGGYSISEQAEHFEVSEIRHQQEGIVYIYKPEAGFTGKVVVKIKRADSNGAEIYAQTITTLEISVLE